MNAKVIDIGRYVRVPVSIVTAKISSRAREVWILIAMNASPEKPTAWVRQQTLAEQLGCSTDVIGRAIAELIRMGLLCQTPHLHQGRYKIYIVNWSPANSQHDLPQKCTTTLRTNPTSPTATTPNHPPQKCGPLIRVLEKQEKNNSSEDHPRVNSKERELVGECASANLETEEEREWIISKIKTSVEAQKKKDALDAQMKARFGRRGGMPLEALKLSVVDDRPICRANHPLMWDYLRIVWAEGLRKLAA